MAADSTLGPTSGVREAWHRGRERYALWVIRVANPEIARRAEAIAMSLGPRASPVPTDQQHITLFVCGFPLAPHSRGVDAPPKLTALSASPSEQLSDDVEPALLDEQIAALQSTRLPSFEVLIGGVNAFLTAPFLEVSDPTGGIARLRERLMAPWLRRGLRELRFAPFVPHLTIAHFDAGLPTREIAACLLPYRELGPLSYRVQALELVDFCARTAHAPFRVLAQIALD